MSYFKAGVRLGLIASGAFSTVVLFNSVAAAVLKRVNKYLDEKFNSIKEEQPDTSDDLK